MTKNYNLQRVVLSMLFAIMISQVAFSQTLREREQITKDYNQDKLTALQQETQSRFRLNKQRAEAYAVKNNIPILLENENGTYAELQRIAEDGSPIYYSISNDDAAISTRANWLNTGGGLGLDLNGDNLVAHVWDAGQARSTHQEYDGPGGTDRFSIGDGTTALHFHAAHVTGTIIASGVQPAAKGMAWQADAVGYDWTDDVPEATAAASGGMLLSNHSYGFIASAIPDWYFGAYIQDSHDWDNLMYNAPYYLMVVAAGNDGNDNGSNGNPLDGNSAYDKLSGHATSKNNMVVANGQDANINGDGSLNSVVRNSGSSEGPTDDYRIKPDIMGNGTGLYSTYQNTDTQYASISGTSMASPNVCGSMLLLQEHNHNLNGVYMRAATLKGLTLHTADDVGAIGPDAQHGWGLMNSKFAAETLSNNGLSSWVSEETLGQGETFTMTVQSDGSNPLLASISWTDPAGTINSGTANDNTPVLVNDLDIRVDNGTTYMPWRLTGPNTNGSGDNVADPFERVDINGASGTYTITVTHKGTLTNGPQRFSLVVTGIASDFTFGTTNSAQTVCSNNDAVYTFAYDEVGNPPSTNLTANNVPTGATVNFSQNSINADGNFDVTFGNLIAVPAGTYEIDIIGDNGSESETKRVELRVIHADFSSYPQSLSTPANGALGQPRSLDVTWASNVNAENYYVEVSTDPSFTTVDFSGTESDVNFALSNLNAETVYYWRVRPDNSCAMGNWSETYSFQTGTIDCSFVYTATDTPVAISNLQDNSGTGMGNGWSIANINVTDTYTIDSMTAYINLTHTWLADLTLYLEAPDDSFITMIDGACTDNDDIDATFTDAGSAPACSGIPAISGNITPDQPMSTFNNKNINGNWQFYVNDPHNGDDGTIRDFTLNVCSVAPVSGVPSFVNNGITVPASSTYTILNTDINGTSAFAPTDIQYRLLALPTLGNIELSGTPLMIGDTFTQEQVNTGLVTYTNTHVCGVNANDSFVADVFDTNTNGWIPNQTIPITIDCLLSANEFTLDNIGIWPNPNNGEFNVRFNNPTSERISMTLFDIQGRRVYQEAFEEETGLFDKSINLGALSEGVYLLNIRQGNKVGTKKIVINK